MRQRLLTTLEQLGVVRRFEITCKASLQRLRDCLVAQGAVALVGFRDAIHECLRRGLVVDGDASIAMLEDRQNTAYVCDKQVLKQTLVNVQQRYLTLFSKLEVRFGRLASHNA
ncbi:MAG: nucleotidyltransferase substrate binding protein [Burkholderiaceae bacterium]|nr:nucleotidyltransferase substrate binding protein [Burkholderiaceae bacterium]MCD8537799.1 nucleotidyltransferase substrate binding protein [Burkholderiaceae bacterium]MCD8564895.1 nucleotidyltransferase substrate binding protein [Burkholderiaceae bacterium]